MLAIDDSFEEEWRGVSSGIERFLRLPDNQDLIDILRTITIDGSRASTEQYAAFCDELWLRMGAAYWMRRQADDTYWRGVVFAVAMEWFNSPTPSTPDSPSPQ